MNEFGGYYELSGLISQKQYHEKANYKLNSVTNAIIFCLKNRQYDGVYLPYYNCEVVRRKLLKHNIKLKFYHIDENFYPKIKNNQIELNYGFLYIDYFGINYGNSLRVAEEFGNLILDNSQAFFSPRIKNIDTIYSPRKFFCVTDGAYLYSDVKNSYFNNIDFDKSHNRYSSILKKYELNSNLAYGLHKANELEIEMSNVLFMSKSTEYLLSCIDYKKNSQKNLDNFLYIHKKLSKINHIKINIDELLVKKMIPMIYPLLNEKNIKQQLVDKKIYVSSWWNYLLSEVDIYSFEFMLSKNLNPLPIDYRYNKSDLNYIINQVQSIYDN